MSSCVTCDRTMTLQQVRAHMWEQPDHDVEIDSWEAWADEQAWRERTERRRYLHVHGGLA